MKTKSRYFSLVMAKEKVNIGIFSLIFFQIQCKKSQLCCFVVCFLCTTVLLYIHMYLKEVRKKELK